MNRAYRVFLAINATSWMLVVYFIKIEYTIAPYPAWLFSIFLLLIPIVFSKISLILTCRLSRDNIDECCELKDVNNTFLPTYLGYFFIGIGIVKCQLLIFVYLIVLSFTYLSQSQYFNPIFLLFGYRFYEIKTSKGTNLFLIARKNLRNINDVKFTDMRRINDTTFFVREDKE